jgi:tRNA modification GTPase
VHNAETIISLATPAAESALGIIRISGPLSVALCKSIFGLASPTPRKSILKYYKDTENNIIDHVIFVYFKKNNSFTGEDMIEISFHGNMIIANQILDDLILRKCRLAEPGEYSKRAFLNGKFDLTQAEAIAELISSKSEAEIQIAKQKLLGRFKKELIKHRNKILQLQTAFEAAIDFPEDDIKIESYENKILDLNDVTKEIKKLINSSRIKTSLNNGIKIVIIGPPNAGKSSLFNKLLHEKRSIVNDKPGTTRDYISEYIKIGKFNIQLFDTAGIRSGKSLNEDLGVELSFEMIEEATLLLLVLDSSTPYPTDFKSKTKEALSDKNIIIIENKSDLEKKICSNEYPPSNSTLSASIHNEKCSEMICDQILDELDKLYPNDNFNDIIVNKRQMIHLVEASNFLDDSLDLIKSNEPEEFILQKLRLSTEAINLIIGESTNEDMLDMLFKNFCIGK